MTERVTVIEEPAGPPPRFADAATRDLNRLSRTFEDVQGIRKAHQQRLAQDLFGPGQQPDDADAALKAHPEVERFAKLEDVYTRELKKVLKTHVLWPWLEPLKGLSGARTGRLIAAIANPHRFPGQQCSVGHTFPPVLPVGTPCPLTEPCTESEDSSGVGAGDAESTRESDTVTGVPPHTEARSESDTIRGVGAGDADRRGESGAGHGVSVPAGAAAEGSAESDRGTGGCPGTILPPRDGSGCRSVWHYLGLMPGQDGKLVRRRKGQQASFSPQLRALVLGEQGLADQIVRHRTQPYRDVYDEVKARKLAPAGKPNESDASSGGLSAARADRIARTVAVKRFIGDLLVEWKRRTPEPRHGIDPRPGGAS